MPPIYLDYNATTPIDPRVIKTMLPILKSDFGNPSSSHTYGRAAYVAVKWARSKVAELLNAGPDEIVFTGGGSEANNHAIKGIAFAKWSAGPPHIVTTAVEHPATLKACDFIGRLGGSISVLAVDQFGRVEPDAVRRAITPRTVLVTVMHSNNEVGTLQPIREIVAIAHERGVLVHADAAQSVGKVEVDVRELDVDLLSLAGHKLYAPKGVGVLFVSRRIELESLIHGADHEHGRRAGTENVPCIVGLGAASEIAYQELYPTTARLRRLRDRLWDRLHAMLGERISLNGHPTERLPNTLNVNFLGHIGAELLAAVPEIAASTGSACHEGQVKLSPVLAAMGVPPDVGRGAVRLSVGRFTTEAEIDRAADLLVAAALARC
jgi:cysteine desulfurase